MELDKLKAADICKIIKECANSGVTELTLGADFCVSFSHKAHLEEETTPSQPVRGEFPSVQGADEEQVRDIAHIQDLSERRNEEIQDLLVSDPYEYEQLASRGELEDAQEENIGSDADASGQRGVG